MTFTLFETLFSQIDAATTNYVSTISSTAIADALPVVSVALVCSWLLQGVMIMYGAVEAPLLDVGLRFVKVTIILAIAGAGGFYQSDIAAAVQATPNELASSLIPTSNTQESQSAAQLIDQAGQNGYDAAGKAFENSGIFSAQGLAYAAYGVIMLLATSFMVGVGGAFILLAKLAMTVLVGLGPFFIFALLFKSTARFFEAWVGEVLSYGFLVVLVAAVFGLLLALFATYTSNVTFDGALSFAGTLGGAVVLAIVCCIITIQLPSIASKLAGGVGIELFGSLRAAAGAASAPFQAGAAGVKGIKSAGAALGKLGSSEQHFALGKFKGSAAG